MTKVLFIFQEVLMKHVLAETPAAALSREFFLSDRWLTKPNSTSRLNLANYQALSSLAEFDVEFCCVNAIDSRLDAKLRAADIIVLNQVRSPGSLKFTSLFTDWLAQVPVRPKVVFGTELSWFTELEKGAVTTPMLEEAYFGNLLLRHTGKTDRPLYARETAHNAVIQEFPLGVDTDVVRYGLPVSQRRYISFVRAPEGRGTKNNDAIDAIIERIRQSKILARFEVRVLSPPYTSVEYWDTMAESAFFVFTSNGETFSYCLNDAKAAGAVSFFPNHMYYTVVGNAFAVDSYPWSGLRYGSMDDLIERMESIASDEAMLEAESRRARQCVVDHFSITTVASNWATLLRGERLNTEKLFIYDGDSGALGWSSVVARCKASGARYAMPYRNRCAEAMGRPALTWHDTENDIVLAKYYLGEDAAGLHRVVTKQGDLPVVGRYAPQAKETADETARFLQLACRLYRVGEVVVDSSVQAPPLVEALDKVTSFAGLCSGQQSISTTFLSKPSPASA